MNNNLVVISNHLPSTWSKEQLAKWEGIIYIQFPNVPPEYTTEQVHVMVLNLIQQHERTLLETKNVCIQGEFTFVLDFYRTVVEMALPLTFWIPTTERVAVETTGPNGETKKESVFRFVSWRKI